MQYHFFDGEKSCFGFQLDYRGDKDRGEKVPKVADWDFDEDDLGLHCGVRHLLARPFFKVLRRCCRRQLLPKSLSAMASTSSAAKTTFDIGKVKQEVVEQEQAQVRQYDGLIGGTSNYTSFWRSRMKWPDPGLNLDVDKPQNEHFRSTLNLTKPNCNIVLREN